LRLVYPIYKIKNVPFKIRRLERQNVFIADGSRLIESVTFVDYIFDIGIFPLLNFWGRKTQCCEIVKSFFLLLKKQTVGLPVDGSYQLFKIIDQQILKHGIFSHSDVRICEAYLVT